MLFADPPFKACCKYTSFSESDKLRRSYTDTLNCSQKVLQASMLLLNAGTSSLCSLTPFASTGVGDGAGVDSVGERLSSLIRSEQNASSSKRECNTNNSSDSSRSNDISLRFKSKISFVITQLFIMLFALAGISVFT